MFLTNRITTEFDPPVNVPNPCPLAMPRKSATASIADHDAAPGGVAAVDRALSLLQAFRAGDPPLTLAILAERTRLYKSTVLRLLASLEHAMLVERTKENRYVLSHGVARLQHVYAASYSLERVVLPELQRLVDATGESAAFHVQWGSGANAQRISLLRVDSPQPIRDHYKAGDMLPMSGGVGAKVLIAFGADTALAKAQKDQQLLASIRQQGYHAAVGDRDPDVAGISAPVFKSEAAQRTLAGSLILTMPAARYTTAHIQPVVQAAARLSAMMGGTAIAVTTL
jgi:DNA-binding IclR family transcriptional regulator